MIKDILLLVLAAFVSYFIGTINFSKIIAWKARKKDITKIGSHNPGTMNMLRSFGFGLALLTFIGEIVKAGLTCLTFKLIWRQHLLCLAIISQFGANLKAEKVLLALWEFSSFLQFGMLALAGLQFALFYSCL